MTKKVMICAGEASGDLHAANLIHELRQLEPALAVEAMGSDKLREAGADILVDCRDLAVVGLVEVIKHWKEIQAALELLKQRLHENRPDLLILVDYVEFNLKLAKAAKDMGIKVMFYVSPQVWAWRAGRVPKIGQAIDMMAVIFPFETEIYEQHNIPVRFVGHPLAEEVHPTMDKAQALQSFALSDKKKTVALLPGSRKSEIGRILPIMLESAKLVRDTLGDSVQFVLPVAPTLSSEDLQPLLSNSVVPVQLVKGQSHDVVNVADAAMVASGTATLEVALLGTPMSIVYRVSKLSYTIMSRMIQVEHIGLANIVAGERVVPEFIQDYANPWLIAEEVVRQLTDSHYAAVMCSKLGTVKEKLGSGGGSRAVATLAWEMLEGKA